MYLSTETVHGSRASYQNVRISGMPKSMDNAHHHIHMMNNHCPKPLLHQGFILVPLCHLH
jgi:hypothetical protein